MSWKNNKYEENCSIYNAEFSYMRFLGSFKRKSYSYGKIVLFLRDSYFTRCFQECNPAYKREGPVLAIIFLHAMNFIVLRRRAADRVSAIGLPAKTLFSNLIYQHHDLPIQPGFSVTLDVSGKLALLVDTILLDCVPMA